MEFLELLLAAKSGDKESRDLLIEENIGLVWSVVRWKIYSRLELSG